MTTPITQAVIKLLLVEAVGSGCPKPTPVTMALSEDKTELATTIDGFAVETGPMKPDTARLRCFANVTLSGAPGWQFKTDSLEVDLDGTVAEGTTARAEVTTEIAPFTANEEATSTRYFKAGELKAHKELFTLSGRWSKCGQEAPLRQSLALIVKGNKKGVARLKSANSWRVKLTWRPCS